MLLDTYTFNDSVSCSDVIQRRMRCKVTISNACLKKAQRNSLLENRISTTNFNQDSNLRAQN